MSDLALFALAGTDSQRDIAADALAHCTFPWSWLAPGLRHDVGREQIPVEWADLSRYQLPPPESGQHLHVHEDGDTADPIMWRRQVLGLAWYSGKITVEATLEQRPQLAAEVILAEVAHMVDFFYMSDLQRLLVYNAFHRPDHQITPGTPLPDGQDMGHGHGWFDVGGYFSWVGEAFMDGFARAYSDLPIGVLGSGFDHGADDWAVRLIRAALDDPAFFGVDGSAVFHDDHAGIGPDVAWRTTAEAQAAGRRACRVCRPGRMSATTSERNG